MWGFFKWVFIVPAAALVTAALFLLVANQIAPRPFIYRSADDPDKIIFLDFDIICMCRWLPITNSPPVSPGETESSNAWTRSDKAVTDAPRVPEEKPAMPERTYVDEGDPHYCHGAAPVAHFPAPGFPKSCQRKHVEGRVVVQFHITAEGKVFNPSIIESDDYCFNSTAISIVSRRRYPAMCNAEDKPVERYNQQATIQFVLEDSS